jgi:hypothetical protein
MKGHVARKGNRWYAVIYDGTDPITGKEKRTWHAAGTDAPTQSGSQLASPPNATAATTKRVR